jgi:hypothetical protein
VFERAQYRELKVYRRVVTWKGLRPVAFIVISRLVFTFLTIMANLYDIKSAQLHIIPDFIVAK